jgi:signal transduction histidine kinase
MPTDRDTAALLFRACHDLRSPNRSVLAYAELLQKKSDDGTPQDLELRLGFIRDGARKIERVVEALAGYALALDTDPSSFQPTRLDVVLRGALARLEPQLVQCSAEVDYSELPSVQGSPDRLMQLFVELVGNALTHRGDDAPRIRIGSSPHPDGVLMSVSDKGPGVDPDDRTRIFQPFEHLHGDGPGLGLAACRAIVEAHGGKIWAESAEGRGLDVRFTLRPA